MPLITVLAPGTRVTVEGMSLPEATIAAVHVRAGMSPVKFDIDWMDGSKKRTARFHAEAVNEVPGQPATIGLTNAELAQLGRAETELERILRENG